MNKNDIQNDVALEIDYKGQENNMDIKMQMDSYAEKDGMFLIVYLQSLFSGKPDSDNLDYIKSRLAQKNDPYFAPRKANPNDKNCIFETQLNKAITLYGQMSKQEKFETVSRLFGIVNYFSPNDNLKLLMLAPEKLGVEINLYGMINEALMNKNFKFENSVWHVGCESLKSTLKKCQPKQEMNK